MDTFSEFARTLYSLPAQILGLRGGDLGYSHWQGRAKVARRRASASSNSNLLDADAVDSGYAWHLGRDLREVLLDNQFSCLQWFGNSRAVIHHDDQLLGERPVDWNDCFSIRYRRRRFSDSCVIKL